MKIRVFIIIAFSTFFACSHNKEIATDRSYAFDLIEYENESSDSLVFKSEKITQLPKDTLSIIDEKLYYIQLGAFKKKSHAERFINENKKFLKEKMILSFSRKVNYYVVQLPPIKIKEVAYKRLNEIRANNRFSDAFIIPVQN